MYKDAGEGLKAVRDDFHYWTGRLTDTSLQFSFAVIAANWAVFESVNGILGSGWARASVAVILVGLAINLVGAKVMGELHDSRIHYAIADVARWEADCANSLGRTDAWPFTRDIERLGRLTREAKFWLPLAGGVLLLIGIARG